MSDPVTHAEIEDVLSSIRRLVSEDSRGQPAAPEPAARLVLTPALRVQAPENGPENLDSSPSDDEPAAEAAEAAIPTDEDSAASFPAGTVAAAEIAEAAEALAGEPPIAFRHRSAFESEAADTQDKAEPGSSPAALQPDAGPEREPALADAPWADPSATLYSAAADADGPKEALGTTAAAVSGAAGPASGTAGARAASVVRKIAELEARSSRSEERGQQHWEPDSQTEAPFAGTVTDTIEWRDEPLSASRAVQDSRRDAADEEAAEAAEMASSEDTAAEAIAAEPLAGAASAETVAQTAFTDAALETLGEAADTYLDEDSLRDLVAGIVREELQGPLGERITRNVRKLVRREIHRALAAHDLL